MRYQAFDLLTRSRKPLAATLATTQQILKSNYNPLRKTRLCRAQSAVLATSQRFLRSYPKQEWNFEALNLDGKTYEIEEHIEVSKPFCNLIRFKRQGLPKNAPKVLFAAALSGHHATLSKETFAEFLPDHEVYVTDWLDGRYVPLSEGPFSLEDYVQYLIDFIKHIGPNVNLVGLCQAGPAALICAVVMSETKDKCKPKSISMLASPMDTAINPGLVSKVSQAMNIDVWRFYGLHKVPSRYPGAGRLVFPGILQLSNFMSSNLAMHVGEHKELIKNIYHERREEVEKHVTFYDEYFAMLDMPAEFCLETIEKIFINNELAKGTMKFRGKLIDCAAITDIPLLAMEGANDDMVRPGQCNVVVDMCTGLPKKIKHAYVQEGVGHYGIFNGSKYREHVAPKIKQFISANAGMPKTV